MSTLEKPKCYARIWDDLWRRHKPCTRHGSVERDGKHYCKQHDPVAQQLAEEKRLAAHRQKSEEHMKVYWLRSAAPDLLDVVENWIYGAEAMGWNTDKARAAIAKAKGEAKP